MMGLYRIDYNRILFVLPTDVCTQLNVRTFHFMIDCLADVMQKSGTFGHSDVQP